MIFLLWFLVAVILIFLAIALWPWIPYAVTGAVVTLATLWILISVLSPAVPNRTCPRCRRAGLVKIRRGELGVRCELCDFRDEEMHVAYLDEW